MKNPLPLLTTEQMRLVDHLMVTEFGLELIQMMENAGRNLAEAARRMLGGQVKGQPIAVLCGVGNNGGGGMAAARHLHNGGAVVTAVLAGSRRGLKAVPARQWRSLERIGIARLDVELESQALILDALLGYGARGDPRPPLSGWIERANAARPPILALDAPSGLDTTTGIPGTPCIRAAATLTLALPKVGLLARLAAPWVGRLYLADIGVPPELYAEPDLGLHVPPIFSSGPVIELNPDDWEVT